MDPLILRCLVPLDISRESELILHVEEMITMSVKRNLFLWMTWRAVECLYPLLAPKD